MRCTRIGSVANKSAFSLAVALTVLLQACPFTSASALNFISPARKGQMQTPLDDKLTAEVPSAEPEKPAKKTSKKEKEELAPVTLNASPPPESKAEPQVSESKTDGTQYLKSTVTATGFVPKGPSGPTGTILPSKSVSASANKGLKLGKNKGGSLMDNAKQVNLMPLPLTESESEMEQKVVDERDRERKQLADLWEATLTRSPDIQFVVTRLMPSSEPGRARTVMMRMLSSVMMGGMGAATMMSPNMGMYAMNQMGASMIMNVLNMTESKNAKRANFDENQAIVLYNMIRQQADKLVANYRRYKTDLSVLDRATKDLSDLQSMAAEAAGGQDGVRQLEMQYTIRKAQRDADKLTEEIRFSRDQLVDLAGPDAVSKLDRELSGPFPVAETAGKDKPI